MQAGGGPGGQTYYNRKLEKALVARIADCLKEVLVARWTAAILRWPVPLAPEAQRSGTRIPGNNVLDHNVVLPVVAEVVGV